MNIYLDDERPTPNGWTRCYWPDEVIALLETGQVTGLSLDHDLGDDSRGTGYDVVKWLEEAVATRGFKPPAYLAVHSANGPAGERMRAGIYSIQQMYYAQAKEHNVRWRAETLGKRWNARRPSVGYTLECSCGWTCRTNENKRNAKPYETEHKKSVKSFSKKVLTTR